jgi:hypothetical protein
MRLRSIFSPEIYNTNLLPLANFAGCIVGFLNVCTTRDLQVIRLLASSLPPRYPLNATWYNAMLASDEIKAR